MGSNLCDRGSLEEEEEVEERPMVAAPIVLVIRLFAQRSPLVLEDVRPRVYINRQNPICYKADSLQHPNRL